MQINKNLIFDVGLHIGQDTEFYLKKGFDVVAIDANPLLVREAEERFAAEIAAGRLAVLNVGIGAGPGRFPFYVNEQLSEWSSFDHKIGTGRGNYSIIDVEMVSLGEILTRFGMPYYLKVDIEGNDFAALESLSSFTNKPKYVSGENGQPEMLDAMQRLGYSAFKFINQQTVSQIMLPVPAREGLDVPWAFPFGSSGPFGEETPGEWLSATDVLNQINTYWGNPHLDANVHGWFDLHGKRFDA